MAQGTLQHVEQGRKGKGKRRQRRAEGGRVEATNGQRSKGRREQTTSETGAGGERKRN